MPTTGQIRRVAQGDFERIVTIENICFSKKMAYSRRQLYHLLFHAHSTVLVETHNRIIRGFVIILYRRKTRVAGIETIDVDPAFRNQGIGHRLLFAAEDDIRKKGMKAIRLEVATTNQAAITLYKNAGFCTTAVLKNYYVYSHSGSRDALRMIKKLV